LCFREGVCFLSVGGCTIGFSFGISFDSGVVRDGFGGRAVLFMPGTLSLCSTT